MKSMRYIAATIVLFIITGVTSAFASPKSVVVTNNTSYTMTEFYASASSSSTWSSTNLFAGQTLAPGQETTININDGLANCTYDLMAVLYGATQQAYTYSVNTCDDDGSEWTISGM